MAPTIFSRVIRPVASALAIREAFMGRAGGDVWTLIVAPAINAGVIGRGDAIA